MDREGDFVRGKMQRGRGRAWAWACVVMLNTVRAELVEAQVVHAALRQAQGERLGCVGCPSTRSGRTGVSGASCPSTSSGRTKGVFLGIFARDKTGSLQKAPSIFMTNLRRISG